MEVETAVSVEERLKEYEELFKYRYGNSLSVHFAIAYLSGILYTTPSTVQQFNEQMSQLAPL